MMHSRNCIDDGIGISMVSSVEGNKWPNRFPQNKLQHLQQRVATILAADSRRVAGLRQGDGAPACRWPPEMSPHHCAAADPHGPSAFVLQLLHFQPAWGLGVYIFADFMLALLEACISKCACTMETMFHKVGWTRHGLTACGVIAYWCMSQTERSFEL